MGIDSIKNNELAKQIIKNELKNNKESGTYLIHGIKGANLFEFALNFSKGILCNEIEHDYCDSCRVCINIDKQVYSDLHIIEGLDNSNISISQIRDMISESYESAYEGDKKVFIIKNIHKTRKEVANAILKIIEEPPKNTYFILTSNSLNILKTILSRCITIKINTLNNEELEVSKEIFDFFIGDNEDILEYKKGNYSLEEIYSYKDIDVVLDEYIENGKLENKIKLLKSLDDYIKNKDFFSEIEKIEFIEKINSKIDKNRDILENMFYILIIKNKTLKKLEFLLEIKSYIKSNVNITNILYNFFLEY
ncbi:DNA polymerase-3 subunit delta' [Hypnocyclicus thermotrophus]|uniref:DNA polymerase-3 subunit delta n=1 Tax=Hypnocyclicus thermotrophus TaxID=1627895 RepID=A0AA46I5M8_9FUSO|nr:DNA polymerase III subunit [Hypnocyclicus thermotrophus]TDT70597.1 DNA polymerase-3 subunit delta' [Hypnocyclicus thermotrophus]